METEMFRLFLMTLVFLQSELLFAGPDPTELDGSRILSGGGLSEIMGDQGGDDNAVVAGGNSNKANASHASILGGEFNIISSGTHSAICGGKHNTVGGNFSFIGGGQYNKTSNEYSAVVAGGGTATADANDASGKRSIVGAGQKNVAGAEDSGIFSGRQNLIILGAKNGFIGGGVSNRVEAEAASICGGNGNHISSFPSLDSEGSHIGGGRNNLINDGAFSVISGGQNNGILGDWSAIPGGHNLTIQGDYSFGFNGSATPYTIANDNIAAFMGVKFAIGTVSPEVVLQAHGDGIQIGGHPVKYNAYFVDGGNTKGWHTGYSTNEQLGVFLSRRANSGISFWTHKSSGGWGERLRIDDGNGNVGINKVPTSSYVLDVGGNIRASGYYYNTSDGRLKNNIATVQSALEKITLLRGVFYEWREFNSSSVANVTPTSAGQYDASKFLLRADGQVAAKGKNLGFIAQELQEVFPELVSEDEDGLLSVAYAPLTAVLVEATKELKQKNDALEEEVETLKSQMQNLMETVYNKRK
jgi:hypothetical protein